MCVEEVEEVEGRRVRARQFGGCRLHLLMLCRLAPLLRNYAAMVSKQFPHTY